uniref:FAM194 domain-containing protein n=1 Tax=Macrostomum lignano TaxID=282301 RepID=A0A1I8FRV1_9PLAT
GRLRLDRRGSPGRNPHARRRAGRHRLRLDPRPAVLPGAPTPPTPRNNSGGVGVLNVDHGRTPGWPGSPAQGPGCGPGQGLLYISLWCGARPGLYTLRMDGSELRPLLTGGRARAGHLALDSEQGRLYWLDMELRGVFSARLNGSDRRAIWHMGSGYDGIPLGPGAVRGPPALERPARRRRLLHRQIRGQPLKLVLPPEHSGSVLSAVVYHSVRQALEVRRAAGGATCGGHICIQAGGSPVCLCDQLSVMKDGVCVPSGDAGRKPGRKQPEPVAAESTGAAQDGSDAAAGQQQSLVAAARSKLTAHEVNPDTEEADQDENPCLSLIYISTRSAEDNQLQCRLKVAARQLYWAAARKMDLQIDKLKLQLPVAKDTPKRKKWAPYQSTYWGFPAQGC